MKIKLSQLRQIIRETVRDTLTESVDDDIGYLFEFFTTRVPVDIRELISFRDNAGKDRESFLRAAAQLNKGLSVPGTPGYSRLIDFWEKTRGMSYDVIESKYGAYIAKRQLPSRAQRSMGRPDAGDPSYGASREAIASGKITR